MPRNWKSVCTWRSWRPGRQRHEFITVEHLLLALLDNPSAAEVLRACAANVDELRKSLTGFIKREHAAVAAETSIPSRRSDSSA